MTNPLKGPAKDAPTCWKGKNNPAADPNADSPSLGTPEEAPYLNTITTQTNNCRIK